MTEPLFSITFEWQLADTATVEQISQWLSSDNFPSPQSSQKILEALVRDQIETDNKEIIERDIAPSLRPSLVIKIGWKGGHYPGDNVHVRERSNTPQTKHVIRHQ